MAKSTKKQPTVVVSKDAKDKKNIPKRKLLFAVALIVLATALVGVVGFYAMHKNKTEQQNNDAAIKQMQELNKEIVMAQDGDVTGAATLLNNQINSTGDIDQKIYLLNKLANIYFVVNKPQDSIATVRKAIALKNNASSWAIMGKGYELNKDYKNAVYAYQQAVNLSTDSKDDGRGDYVTYNGYLVSAKAKQ